jgi:hypothetical protein
LNEKFREEEEAEDVLSDEKVLHSMRKCEKG